MWQIEHQCPQCGAPVTLLETDRILSCPFCRTRLYLTVRETLCYCLPPAPAVTREIFYIPYWRFKGMIFSCRGIETTTKIIDTSIVAAPLKWMPHTLGIRPQALTLRYITPKTAGTLFSPHLRLEDVASRIEGQLDAAARLPLLHRAVIGETASIIFTPLYVHDDRAFDAVLDRPIAAMADEEFTALRTFDQKEHVSSRYISCLCPSCGWDMDGDKETLVLLCKNCHSAWMAAPSGFEKIELSLLPAATADAHYVPFWKIKATVEGIVLKTYADLLRITNSAQVVKKEWEEQDVYFWSPAFKVSPEPFLRLSQRITLQQPAETEMQHLPDATFHPVTLPAQESMESLKVVLAECALPRKEFFPMLPQIVIRAESAKLVYVPFQSSASELINPQMSLSINKNTLRFGLHL